MRFEKLRLSGFKSFVEPAELRIEPGLTGVVGPNGCGKSNLLEAIRWVMGESSPKSLRGGGMEDVIFAGTAQRPARDFAEVVLSVRGALRGERRGRRDRRVAAGSSAAPVGLSRSTAATSARRTSRWSLPTPPPVRTARRWSARAGSPR
jgi:chromosome segregation protein